MREARVALYEIGELTETARQRAIEDNRWINVSWGWWSQLHEDFSEMLKEKGLKGTQFYWDLDRDRHMYVDDLSLTDPSVLALQVHESTISDLELARLVEALAEGRVVFGKRRISHNRERNTVEADTGDFELDRQLEERLGGLLKELLATFLGMVESEHERLTSDEEVEETLKSDGHEFVETGERWPGWG